MGTLPQALFHPTIVAAGVFLLCLCAESLTAYIFLRGLRKRHPAQWRHSGQRTVWTDMDLVSAWGTIRYLQRRQYRMSADSAGRAFCERHRLPVVASYWSAVVTVILFFASLFALGWPQDWS